jgi:hypothetical protein
MLTPFHHDMIGKNADAILFKIVFPSKIILREARIRRLKQDELNPFSLQQRDTRDSSLIPNIPIRLLLRSTGL